MKLECSLPCARVRKSQFFQKRRWLLPGAMACIFVSSCVGNQESAQSVASAQPNQRQRGTEQQRPQPNQPDLGADVFSPRVDQLIEHLEPKVAPWVISEGTQYSKKWAQKGYLPRGSVLLSDSGNLKNQGIDYILQAATGDHNAIIHPTVESIQLTVTNALKMAKKLATEQSHPAYYRVAFPFLGGAIFLSYLLPEKSIDEKRLILVKSLLETALEACRVDPFQVDFVLFSKEEFDFFQTTYHLLAPSVPMALGAAIRFFQGSITDGGPQKVAGGSSGGGWRSLLSVFSSSKKVAQVPPALSSAPLIVNAANATVTFGSGVSGAIGAATGKATQINQAASQVIQNFNQALLQTYYP